MPKNYEGCEVIIRIQPNGEVLDLHGFHIGATAIEVPPHGDLIDRNALPWENQCFMLTDPEEWGLKARDIENAPTIIPADHIRDAKKMADEVEHEAAD